MRKNIYSLVVSFVFLWLTSLSAYSQHIISGNTGVGGATLRYSIGNSRTAQADTNGDYSFVVPSGFTGTVTPFINGKIFSPKSMSYTDVQADQPSQDYTATDTTIGPTVWNGKARITFVKADSADWTLAANQDQIMSSVWITRQYSKGIFNITAETSYTHFSSPVGTEWAIGSINNYNTLSYTSWEGLVGSNPPQLVGRNLVLHLINDDIYLSVRFLSWTEGNGSGLDEGGGFSYIRSIEAAPAGYMPTVWNSTARIIFSKADYVNYRLPVNQDSITSNVRITRGNNGGILNIAGESEYRNYVSPVGTEWAEGFISDYNTLTYTDLRSVVRPKDAVGRDLVMHLIDDDIYLSVKFLSWTESNDGGGFSYTRSAQVVPPATVWDTTGRITFTKGDYADYSMSRNQDSMTSNVRITRKINRGIFNIAAENAYSPNLSPIGTEWAFGIISDYNTLTYTDWQTLSSNNPPSLVGQDLVLHLIEDNIYLSIKFLSWTEGDGMGGSYGGGFSYERSFPSGYIPPTLPVPTVWNGPTMTFTKENSTDWTKYRNQDRITKAIWITRADTSSIFNIATENGYTHYLSPIGTEWAIGSISGFDTLTYTNFENLGKPPTLIGQDIVLHLISDDIYLSIKFLSWTGSNGGGGFSYERSTPYGYVLPVATVWNGSRTKTFVKQDYADWTWVGNQDSITNKVRITRQDDRGIFNIAEENSYFNYLSPAGTEWAVGSILRYDSLTYTDWENLSGANPPLLVGQNLVMHLIEDNIYLKIRFLSWTEGSGGGSTNGGGFSYIRSTGPAESSPVVWDTTGRIIFTKQDYADYKMTRNQDSITNDVRLTRKNNHGVFNIAAESEYDSHFSPKGTEWAVGTTAEYSALLYTDWEDLSNSDPPSLVGQDLVLHLIDSDIYLDIKFLSWTSNNNGGGFSYERSVPSGYVPPAPQVPLVWTGSKMTFIKADSANCNLRRNQDRITSTIWITRQNSGGVFNISREGSFTPPVSPLGTEWAIGSIDRYDSLTYTDWQSLCDSAGGAPDSLIGKDLILHLIADDIYIDIKFLSWSSDANGGGLSYERSTPNGYVPPPAPTVWHGSKITFTKEDFADWTFTGNQDSITSTVRITRKLNEGIFNIAEETGYDYTISPIGTEWAFGTTADYATLSYTDWRTLSGSNPSGLVDSNLVMYLINDNIYLDIKFLSWTSHNDGGGFSYERSQAGPPVSVKSENEVSVPQVFTLSQNYPNPFNPMTMIEFTLAENSKVSLKVYDILGREVATLVNEELKTGVVHQVLFNGSQLSSGIYFYRLNSSKNSLVKKLILLK